MVKKKIKYTLIRVKFCKTASLSTVLLFFITLASCLDSRWIPAFIYGLILYLITVLPAIYLKQYEAEGEVKHG